MNLSHIILIACCLVIVVVMFIAIQKINKITQPRKYLWHYGEQTSGIVLANGQVEYSGNGQICRVEPLGFKFAKEDIGKSIGLLYDPNEPENSMDEKYLKSPIGLIGIMIKFLFLVLLAVMLYIIYRIKG